MKPICIFLITVSIFTFESILHYNVGRNNLTRFELPNLIDFIKIIGIISIFSLLNTFVIGFFE